MAGRRALALILRPAAAAALTLAPIAPYTKQCLQRLGSTTQDDADTTQDDADAGEEDDEEEAAAAALDEELETPGTEDVDEALENPFLSGAGAAGDASQQLSGLTDTLKVRVRVRVRVRVSS